MRSLLLFLSLVLFCDSFAQLRTAIGRSNAKRFRAYAGLGVFKPHQYPFFSQNYETEDFLLTTGIDYSIYTNKAMSSIFVLTGTELVLQDSSPTYPDYRCQFLQIGISSGFRFGVEQWSFVGQLGASYYRGNFTLITKNLRNGTTYWNKEEKANDFNVLMKLSVNRFISYHQSIGIEAPIFINRRGVIISPTISFSYHWL